MVNIIGGIHTNSLFWRLLMAIVLQLKNEEELDNLVQLILFHSCVVHLISNLWYLLLLSIMANVTIHYCHHHHPNNKHHPTNLYEDAT